MDYYEINQLEDIIHEYEDIVSAGDHDIGHNHEVRHRIVFLDERPFKQKHRRIPSTRIDEV